MSRYIDADKLYELIRTNDYKLATRNGSIDYGMFTVGIKQAIDKMPTADVQEVRRGRWLYEDSDIGWTDYKCYDCGNIISTVNQDEDLYSYCPYCGARMDGETE